jgi:hypothetical protein
MENGGDEAKKDKNAAYVRKQRQSKGRTDRFRLEFSGDEAKKIEINTMFSEVKRSLAGNPRDITNTDAILTIMESYLQQNRHVHPETVGG